MFKHRDVTVSPVPQNGTTHTTGQQEYLPLMFDFESPPKLHSFLNKEIHACFHGNRLSTKLQPTLQHLNTTAFREYARAAGSPDNNTLNVRDNLGRAAVHLVTCYGTGPQLTCLFEAGAIASLEDHHGFTIVHYAAISDNRPTLEVALKELGSGAAGRHGGARSPLQVGAICGSISVVEHLIQTYELEEDDKTEALRLGVMYRQDAVCRFLGTHADLTTVTSPVSHFFRSCANVPGYAHQLMNTCKFNTFNRRTTLRLVWLSNLCHEDEEEDNSDKGMDESRSKSVFGKAKSHLLDIRDWLWGEITDLTYGYLSLTDLKLKLFSEVYLTQYIRKCYNRYGMYDAVLYVTANVGFAIITTFLYTLYGILWRWERVTALPPSAAGPWYVVVTVTHVVWVVCAAYLIYLDTVKVVMKLRHMRAALHHELRHVERELAIIPVVMVTPRMVLAGEKKRLEAYKGWRLLRKISYAWFEMLVHLLSLVFVIAYGSIYEDVTQSNISDSGYLIIFVASLILFLNWAAGFISLRIIPITGAFIVITFRVLRAIGQFLVLFLVCFIPTSMVFWKTIYCWGNITLGNTSNTTDSSISLEEAIFRVYRMALADYDYDAGMAVAESISASIWWDVLVMFWMILANIILLNLLIALMGSTFAGAYHEISNISKDIRLKWVVDAYIMMTERRRREFRWFLAESCKPYVMKEGSVLVVGDEGRTVEEEGDTVEFAI